MSNFYEQLEKVLATCFHLPTLIFASLTCAVLMWHLYDIGIAFGQGYIRLLSNQGSVGLYWVHGCCQLLTW